MNDLNLLFAGFGGQGVLFTGKIVAHAGLLENREVSWLPSYGPEMRGGTANCSVCLSDEPIGSPLVTEPEILVAMNGPSYDKFIETVIPGGKVFIDSSLVRCSKKRDDVVLFPIPATQIASEEHLEGMANMILLGKMIRETGFASEAAIKQAVEKCVPVKKQHLLDHNMKAIALGMKSKP
jgi:2-oxoglutarate ferredoxin oxidoreductase subunit gamma